MFEACNTDIEHANDLLIEIRTDRLIRSFSNSSIVTISSSIEIHGSVCLVECDTIS
jgi:hypothetical protein